MEGLKKGSIPPVFQMLKQGLPSSWSESGRGVGLISEAQSLDTGASEQCYGIQDSERT